MKKFSKLLVMLLLGVFLLIPLGVYADDVDAVLELPKKAGSVTAICNQANKITGVKILYYGLQRALFILATVFTLN